MSRVSAGRAKVNRSMIKMYNAEVLSKFPVVQHFLFGSLFRWEKDPDVAATEQSVQSRNQPMKPSVPTRGITQSASVAGATFQGTKTPWAMGAASTIPPSTTQYLPTGKGRPRFEGTKAPWAMGAGQSMSTSTV